MARKQKKKEKETRYLSLHSTGTSECQIFDGDKKGKKKIKILNKRKETSKEKKGIEKRLEFLHVQIFTKVTSEKQPRKQEKRTEKSKRKKKTEKRS